MEFFWFALFAVGVVLASLSSKALGASIVYAIGLSVVYPSENNGLMLLALYILGYILAQFRD